MVSDLINPGVTLPTSFNCGGNPPPKKLILSSTDVHVWRASLEQSELCFQKLEQTLSADEHLRARRFHFEKHQKQFIIGRGLLRTILGLYLGVAAREVQFCYGIHGKPALSEKFMETALRFNLAHSRGLALYTVTKDREIGVDIEKLRPIPEFDRIVEDYFSDKEYAAICSLPAREKTRGFFKCWTLKEAYLKANGNGLFRPLDTFTVSLAPGYPPCLLEVKGFPQEVSRWSLQSFTPAADYTAALAVEGYDWRLKYWQYG